MTCSAGDWTCELGRIADALSGFDLNTFAATLLATVAGAAFAAGFTWWLAERDRPKPVWRIDTGRLPKDADDGFASVKITATNIGDGPAYNASVTIDGESLKAWEQPTAIVETSESIVCWYSFPMTGEENWDVRTGFEEDTREFTWSNPRVKVNWRQPPRRHKERTERHTVKPPLR